MTARPRTWTHVTLWLGLAAVVAGVVVAATTPRPSSGWYAYAPLSDYAFVAGTIDWQLWTGVGLAVAGAVAAAFAAGRLSVRRPR
ncbi:hypothetical protein DEJ13_01505 [Curtobacterium sp. MCLR17_007]|uniref:hypothetical protein n=1 Tax=unclassified Curtobacterium TaxID=257496 RepID=UPI0007006DBF|nr:MULTISPECIES: hypothetical protein [unclassified Curtobacterium]KQS06072.1 hypothetical protein ASG04_15995 [Curtobacterium sp. Leaf183]WIB60531.1 hypothetical protein DEJ13_01505 [Curtobacterium sp. MCLR17_007]